MYLAQKRRKLAVRNTEVFVAAILFTVFCFSYEEHTNAKKSADWMLKKINKLVYKNSKQQENIIIPKPATGEEGISCISGTWKAWKAGETQSLQQMLDARFYLPQNWSIVQLSSINI